MLNTILLQAQGAGWANIIMIVALIGIFYLFMIRPQQKKQNEIKKFREGLKPGDQVVTAGGIYGKIRSVADTTFTVEIAKDIRITIDKGSVYPSAIQAAQDAAEKKS
ncbi:MAG: preprotein translocase subunit YajC [Muribaculaceae bacterium]|nr:preprotein translocase subunit YajC [Muribaculaceae bacterium]